MMSWYDKGPSWLYESNGRAEKLSIGKQTDNHMSVHTKPGTDNHILSST